MKKTRQLYSISKFAYVMRRLYKKEQLTEEESEYILSCSLLLLKEYDNTNEKELFELAYNIVLRYALLSKNYQPLYDVSCNYGFYPSVQFISKNHLLENSTVQDVMINFSVEMNYRNDEYIETYEQHRTRKNIISSKKKSIAFIAPTSSGKSSLIIQHIKSNERIRKAVVLVPTKSLIAQSYMDLRKGIFDRNLENVVKKIYEGSRDEVRNPLLSNCSLEDLKVSRKEKVEKLNQQILVQEKLYYSDTENPIELFRKKLISSGMNQFIDISYDNAVSIMNNIKNCDFSLDVIDIVSWVFTKNVTVINQEFSRLSNPAAVKFYKFFMAELKKGDFAALITSQLEYQLTRAERDKEPYMYVGRDYGDEMGWNENIAKGQKVYVDIRKKSRTQLINLIIVKTKVEQEFLGFQYSRAVNFLHDNGYLSNEKFNLEMYGTNDESKIQLLNLGLSFSILNVLESNNQFKNISLDSHGNMVANKQLSNFKKNQNGLIRYELDKYILFK